MGFLHPADGVGKRLPAAFATVDDPVGDADFLPDGVAADAYVRLVTVMDVRVRATAFGAAGLPPRLPSFVNRGPFVDDWPVDFVEAIRVQSKNA